MKHFILLLAFMPALAMAEGDFFTGPSPFGCATQRDLMFEMAQESSPDSFGHQRLESQCSQDRICTYKPKPLVDEHTYHTIFGDQPIVYHQPYYGD